MRKKEHIKKEDLCFASSEFQFADPSDDEKKWAFSGTAYSGKVIGNHWRWGNLYIDLSSTKLRSGIPVLREHDRERIVGRINSHDMSNKLKIEGKLFKSREDAKDILDLSEDGHVWQMSIYPQPKRIVRLRANESSVVNGHKIKGPATIFEGCDIREVSFVTLGADHRTSAKAFSDANDIEVDVEYLNKEANMELELQLKNMTAERDALQLKNTGLTDQVTKLNGDIVERDKTAREEKLAHRFAEAGIELKEDNRESLLSLSDQQADAFLAQLKTRKPSTPEYMFKDVANEGQDVDEDKLAAEMAEMD